jgi:hypothetical protein
LFWFEKWILYLFFYISAYFLFSIFVCLLFSYVYINYSTNIYIWLNNFQHFFGNWYIYARVLSHICKLSIFMSCFDLKSEYFIYFFIFLLIFCLIYLYVYSFLMFILIILHIYIYMAKQFPTFFWKLIYIC